MTGTNEVSMPARKPSDDDRAIDRLTEALTQFRIDTARAQGETATKLDQAMKKIDSLDGLFSRVSVTEKDIALLREQYNNFMANVAGWKKDSEDDRNDLHNQVEPLKEFKWVLLGGLVAAQVLMGIFGPMLRGVFGLP